MTDNILATILVEHIAKAAAALPAAESAPDDEPRQVVLVLPPPDGRRVRVTFRRFRHRYPRTTRRFWVAESAEVILE